MTDSPLILIVDDSPIQRKIYAATLTSAGYEVIVGQNGLEGIDMALQHAPTLILMDVSMPEMDGLAAVQTLRQYPEMAEVPILALTALSRPEEHEDVYQAGYDAIVDKSSDRTALLETIQAWLNI
jgi:CheY-like chemotaxis protein